jgi:hypothetical protein
MPREGSNTRFPVGTRFPEGPKGIGDLLVAQLFPGEEQDGFALGGGEFVLCRLPVTRDHSLCELWDLPISVGARCSDPCVPVVLRSAVRLRRRV